MYLYKGCRDPIQKITGDAYRKFCGIVNKNSIGSSGKRNETRIDYELIDTAIYAELNITPLRLLSRRLGVSESTLAKRVQELGFEFDHDRQRWVQGDAA